MKSVLAIPLVQKSNAILFFAIELLIVLYGQSNYCKEQYSLLATTTYPLFFTQFIVLI